MRNSPYYHFIIWILLITSLVLLILISPILYKPDYMLSDDFGHFWASGKLFIQGNNPYDLRLLGQIQTNAGAKQSSEQGLGSQTLNPPWSLLIFLPFSFLDYSLARVIWLVINITVVVISVNLIWQSMHGSKEKLGLALLGSFLFSPTYSVLAKGQITPLVLLGIAGFLLYSEGKLNEWQVSICFIFIATKPQLFYLLWPAVILWVFRQRLWKLFRTGIIIAFLTNVILLVFNPQIYSQYSMALREYPYDQWATPTIGSYLRFFWLGVDKFWVQYLPTCIGLVWFIYYYQRKYANWQWRENLSTLVLISLLTSPYAWTYDTIILLPAILFSLTRLIASTKRVFFIFKFSFILISLLNLFLHVKLNEFWFIWLVPTYALWHLAVAWWYQRKIIHPTSS